MASSPPHSQTTPDPRGAPTEVRHTADVTRWASLIGGSALAAYGARRGSLLAAPLGLAGAWLAARGATGRSLTPWQSSAVRVRKAVTIRRPIEEVYGFWRSLEGWPGQMDHVEAVTRLGEKRSHWIAKGPLGQRVQWDAEITEDRGNELIAWRSIGGDISHRGIVRFNAAPGGRGTEVRVTLEYQAPAGHVGALAARLLGEGPEHQVQEDLRRIKRLLETGEVATPRTEAGKSRPELRRAA